MASARAGEADVERVPIKGQLLREKWESPKKNLKKGEVRSDCSFRYTGQPEFNTSITLRPCRFPD